MPLLQMRFLHLKQKEASQNCTVMIGSNVWTLALIVLSCARSGGPQSVQEQWAHTDDNAPFEYNDEMTPAVNMWPEASTEVGGFMSDVPNMSPAPWVQLLNGQASKETQENTAVWKIALVVSVLLVSLVGSLSVAYYLYIWRGGRIYYQAQRECSP